MGKSNLQLLVTLGEPHTASENWELFGLVGNVYWKISTGHKVHRLKKNSPWLFFFKFLNWFTKETLSLGSCCWIRLLNGHLHNIYFLLKEFWASEELWRKFASILLTEGSEAKTLASGHAAGWGWAGRRRGAGGAGSCSSFSEPSCVRNRISYVRSENVSTQWPTGYRRA